MTAKLHGIEQNTIGSIEHVTDNIIYARIKNTVMKKR